MFLRNLLFVLFSILFLMGGVTPNAAHHPRRGRRGGYTNPDHVRHVWCFQVTPMNQPTALFCTTRQLSCWMRRDDFRRHQTVDASVTECAPTVIPES